jgi:hypothetical protein
MNVWRSATSMTWLATGVRLGGFAVLLPLVLARFSDGEMSVWLLFSTIASLQVVLDFGFSPTFSREIAYGFAGRSMTTAVDPSGSEGDIAPSGSDNAAITVATGTMLWLYRWIAVATLLLLVIAGTGATWIPIERLGDPATGWLAWICVVLGTPFALYGNAYSAFLIGANRIALQKRWEAMVATASLIAQSTAVAAGAGLFGLVLVAQLGLVAQVMVNKRLAFRVYGKPFMPASKSPSRTLLMQAMWPAAWRTAIGSVMSFGVSQGMAIAMANLLAATQAASVQLALRIMQIINQLSQAPFYTRIPELNRLRAARKPVLLGQIAARSMRSAFWVFVTGALGVDILFRRFLVLIGSQMRFPDNAFWLVLALAVFFERFGAMHVNLLLTRNRAIAHFTNGVTAIIWIAGMLILFPSLGMFALPVSMLVAYAGFYAPCAAYLSHAAFNGIRAAWRFEFRTSLAPLCTILIYAAFLRLGWH